MPRFETHVNDPMAARLNEVMAFIERSELKSAADALNRARAQAPGEPRIQLVALWLSRAARNSSAELQCAQRLVDAAPAWALAQIEYAATLSRRGEFDRAVLAATEAAKLSSKDISVLETATTVARAAGDHIALERFLLLALAIKAGNAQIERSLAYCYIDQKRFDEALAILDRLLLADSRDATSFLGRAHARRLSGNTELAIADYESCLNLVPNDEQASYYLAISKGETPSSQPISSNAALFDSYATRFDKHLVGGLQYSVPREVAEIVRQRYPTLECSVLDLGSGTGLLGVYLGKPRGALVGVDISTGMIAQAVKHNVYDRFHAVNLLDALRDTPADQFEVIAACDVLIYVGELAPVLAGAHKVLCAGGTFIFSCEETNADEPDLTLRITERYAHRRSAAVEACNAAGFVNVQTQDCELRLERGESIRGFIVIADKAASA
jgi:predicted TPR repeat methyltransferase